MRIMEQVARAIQHCFTSFFLPRKYFLDIFDNIHDLHSHVSMTVSISYRTSAPGDFIKISPLEDQQKHKWHCVILLSK